MKQLLLISTLVLLSNIASRADESIAKERKELINIEIINNNLEVSYKHSILHKTYPDSYIRSWGMSDWFDEIKYIKEVYSISNDEIVLCCTVEGKYTPSKIIMEKEKLEWPQISASYIDTASTKYNLTSGYIYSSTSFYNFDSTYISEDRIYLEQDEDGYFNLTELIDSLLKVGKYGSIGDYGFMGEYKMSNDINKVKFADWYLDYLLKGKIIFKDAKGYYVRKVK